jgi:hypothetical protein
MVLIVTVRPIANANTSRALKKNLKIEIKMIKFYILAAIGAAFAAAADSIVILAMTTAIVILLYSREKNINGN